MSTSFLSRLLERIRPRRSDCTQMAGRSQTERQPELATDSDERQSEDAAPTPEHDRPRRKGWFWLSGTDDELTLACRKKERRWKAMSVQELQEDIARHEEELLSDPAISNRLKYLLTEDPKYLTRDTDTEDDES